MLLQIFIPLSLAVIMFSLGVGLTLADFRRVRDMPRAVITGSVMQIGLLPLLALAALIIWPQPPEMAFGVMLLSFCPGGVTSSLLTRFAGGNVALSVTLTAVVSLIAVLTVPVLVDLAAPAILGADAPPVSVFGLGLVMFLLTALPVLAGVLLRHMAPALGQRLDRVLAIVASLLFLVLLIGAVAQNFAVLRANMFGVGMALITLNILALAVGMGVARLLGLGESDATAIGIELGVQNAALGITLAGLVQGHGALEAYALPPAVYGVTMYLVTLPYVFWRLWQARRGRA